jgi:hypothetical protein
LQGFTALPSTVTVQAPQSACTTAVLGAGQSELGAQHPQQHAVIVGVQRDGLPVQLESDRGLHVRAPSRFDDDLQRLGARGLAEGLVGLKDLVELEVVGDQLAGALLFQTPIAWTRGTLANPSVP